MEKSKDQRLQNFVKITKKRSNHLVESTFKFLVLEEPVTLGSMSLHHQLTAVQDWFICTDLQEEMLQNHLEE